MEKIRVFPGYIADRASVIALGNFDGVHLGHQKLLEIAKQRADEKGVMLSVMLIDPHPFKVLFPEQQLNLLMDLSLKINVLEFYGVSRVYILAFNRKIAETPPQVFAEKMLKHLKTIHAVIGFNFSFGAKGRGTPKDLLRYGQLYGFDVDIVGAQMWEQKVISSTAVRDRLLCGDIESARKMTGRNPVFLGQVVAGERRGRKLGYPTANLTLEEDVLIPKKGVYAVRGLVKGVWRPGMMNIGVRPTFGKHLAQTIEVHFFDFSEDIYGQEILIQILSKLREEREFQGSEEIIRQLERDKKEALVLLNSFTNELKWYKMTEGTVD